MQKVLVIVGPTGVGKTELSLRVAETLNCPIIGADSRQIYQELPIGTAAPTIEERKRVQHYFVGNMSIRQDYNAGQYERDCLSLLTELSQKPTSVVAVVTGGSMLYIDALCNGLDAIPTVNEAIQQQCRSAYKENGLGWLQKQVQEVDPSYWETVDQHNPQRLMHCLEVTLQAGKPYSTFRTRQSTERPWQFVKIGLKRNRTELYKRINERVTAMMDHGLLDEALNAFEQLQLHKGDPLPNSLNTVGYKELWNYACGEWTLEQAADMIRQNSRHYAKRQMTWFNRDNTIHWLDAGQDIEQLKSDILTIIQ